MALKLSASFFTNHLMVRYYAAKTTANLAEPLGLEIIGITEDMTRVIGDPQEVMILIGVMAFHGEDTLCSAIRVAK